MTAKPTQAALVPEVGVLDERRLARMRRLAYVLDSSLGIPGTRFRFGLDAIIGLVPGLGDIVGGLLSLYIIAEASRLGVPRPILVRMGWNVALDVLVGEVPVLGDLFDAGYKTNLRNLALLDTYLQRPADTVKANRRLLLALVLGLVLFAAGAVALAIVLVRAVTALVS